MSRLPTLLGSFAWMIVFAVTSSGFADWPQYSGPDGAYTPPVTGLALVEDANAIERVWVSEYDQIGQGKFGAMARRFAESHPRGDLAPFGGMSWPVIADGIVYQVHFIAKYRSDDRSSDHNSAFGAVADDVLVAIDAATGKTLWVKKHEGSGLTWWQTKRGGWGASAAVADGKVIHVGTAGNVWCYNAKTGEEVWASALGKTHEGLSRLRDKLTAEGKSLTGMLQVHPVIVGGVVVAASPGKKLASLHGLELKSGKLLWTAESVIEPGVTPGLWKHDGATDLIVHDGGGTITCPAPETGKPRWTFSVPANDLISPIIEGDILLLNVDGKTSDPKHRGRYGGIRLKPDGAELAWTLPDNPLYGKEYTKDHGGSRRAIGRDGRFIIAVDGPNKQTDPNRVDNLRLLVVDAQTGKVLDETPHGPDIGAASGTPALSAMLLAEDRLIAHVDPVHATRPSGITLFRYADGKLTFLSNKADWPDDPTAGGYDVNYTHAYSDGRIYLRTASGQIACYDLRRSK